MKTKMLVGVAACAAVAFGGGALARGGGGHGGGHASFGGSHSSSHSSGFRSDHMVRGYTNSHGTYVAPYHATNRNGTKGDNYSTRGNVNPYTGKEGTKSPY